MAQDDTAPDILERLEKAEQLKLDGNHEEAIELLEQLLFEDPENVSALEEIADNELSLARYDRAEVAAKQAIALDAESYTAYYILGFLRSRTEQWQEAIDHLRKSNRLKPNNPEILRCLGWALFHAGERAQGIVTLERSLNLDNESALTLCDLGVAYLQVQNFTKSKTLFQRALDLDPENPRAQECLQAVERLSTMVYAEKTGEKVQM
jgi:tetratricopeptide (TPR) repeat protein